MPGEGNYDDKNVEKRDRGSFAEDVGIGSELPDAASEDYEYFYESPFVFDPSDISVVQLNRRYSLSDAVFCANEQPNTLLVKYKGTKSRGLVFELS